jgi:hypothetical protein
MEQQIEIQLPVMPISLAKATVDYDEEESPLEDAAADRYQGANEMLNLEQESENSTPVQQEEDSEQQEPESEPVERDPKHAQKRTDQHVTNPQNPQHETNKKSHRNWMGTILN